MNHKLLHTPDGVRDLTDLECAGKLDIQDRLRKVFHSFGFRDIETPAYEYFDVFGNEIGTTPSNELFKFFDRDGNTLVLRPDFTPSIARAAVRCYHPQSSPVRLCYQGDTFINHQDLRGRLKEQTQMGAELLGDASAEADAEMIAMAVEILRSAGLTEFQITLGNASFFELLSDEASLSDEMKETIRNLIMNKNMFGVEKLLLDVSLPQPLRDMFSQLSNLYGGREVLDRALGIWNGASSSRAILRLQEVYDLLCVYHLERYISFDLGMMSSYAYYTGIVFRGYTYGTGEAIVKGGRYDRLLGYFGSEAPSIGFVVVVQQLLEAISRQGLTLPETEGITLIRYTKQYRSDAISEASRLRARGERVEMRLIQDPDREQDRSVDDGGKIYQDYVTLC